MFLFLALLVSTNCGYSYRLGMLGEVPDWSLLDKYQKTMSREEFVEALETVYMPYGVDDKWITIFPGYALIRTNSDESSANYRVDFAPWGHEENESDKLEGESPETGELPLQGLVIAVDPGHIGGNYSAMERRHFQIGQDAPVKEGDLTLQVSRKLKQRLENLGASVELVRKELEPVTQSRPSDFLEESSHIEQQIWLESQGVAPAMTPWETEWFKRRVQERAEMLFYRVSEIQARADIINKVIHPDLTIAVHFDVSPWVEPTHQVLPEENHLHLLVNGTYMPSELALDDIRFHLFRKLLTRNHELEIPMGAAVANSLTKTTGLPAYFYGGQNASNQGNNPFLWARNLLANRLYQCPVIYLEAFCANSIAVYGRIQMGDYDGLMEFDGQLKVSLFEEYTEGVVQGVVDYFSRER
jgi:hypothetical protein